MRAVPAPPIRLSGYIVLSDVGVRPNAQVYKVRQKPHEDVPQFMDEQEPCFALKYIELAEHNLPAEGKQQAVREAQALLDLQHANVVKYHKAFLYEGRLCYMTEFAEGGTLHHLIYTVKEQGQRLPEELVWHLFVQICHGLKKLHDCKIIHRALKTRNLLLFPEELYSHPQLKYRCKLTDLGIPELQRHLRLSSLSGSTLRYLAPEVLAKQPQDEKVDVWALGCVLYEMVTLSHAFNSTSAIQRAEYAPLPAHVSAELAQLLQLMLHPEPQQRPSVGELLQLPTVRLRAAELPSPVLLDSPCDACDTCLDTGRSHEHDRLSGEEGEGRLGADGGARMPAALQRPSAHLPVPPGTPCWAKHGSDGLWYRGVVHSSVDADCHLVAFNERQCIDTVWPDGLRVVDPLDALSGSARERGGVILGFGKEDMLKAELKEALANSKRLVRWSEELSSQGEREEDEAARRAFLQSERSQRDSSGYGAFETGHRPSVTSNTGHRSSIGSAHGTSNIGSGHRSSMDRSSACGHRSSTSGSVIGFSGGHRSSIGSGGPSSFPSRAVSELGDPPPHGAGHSHSPLGFLSGDAKALREAPPGRLGSSHPREDHPQTGGSVRRSYDNGTAKPTDTSRACVIL